jgi:hypothetical protein
LAWLEQELRDAEKDKKAVWIIGHIPVSYKDCSPQWSLRYSALIERFQHIIRFTTYGHIHTEEYVVNRSLTTNNPIGVEYIGGNFGSFDGMNPTTRLYTFH